mgnify:CR=1 FL=1
MPEKTKFEKLKDSIERVKSIIEGASQSSTTTTTTAIVENP